MTKKDFELIAGVLASYNNLVFEAVKGNRKRMVANAEDLLSLMATALENTNPRFDRPRFLTAAGLEVLIEARALQSE